MAPLWSHPGILSSHHYRWQGPCAQSVKYHVWRGEFSCMSRISRELMGTPDELFHWIPGEMVVVVRLPRLPVADQQDILVEQVRTILNELLAQYHLKLEIYGTHGRWITVPAMPPIRRHSFVFGLRRNQPLIAIFFHTRHEDPEVADPLPMALSYLQTHLDYLVQMGIQVVSAMPNWLVTAAPVFYSEGGPTIPPRPAPTLDVPASADGSVGWHLHLQEEGFPLDSRGAEDVLVAVLDTAPHPDRILNAALQPELRRNWLLQSLAKDLRSEDGSFVVEYDRYPLTDDVRTGRDRVGEMHYYRMPDHGLAVAGLIRDMAPKARIRLIRVLNDYGGGDLYSLFAALTDLERELVTGSLRHLVINLSLTVMPDVRRVPYVWFNHREWSTTQLHGAVRILSHIEEGLRLLFDSLYAHGALIVAAAGNDSLSAVQQGLPRRPPRAPARYETTLGVTCVNSNFAPSSFANLANIPPNESGIATFGGDIYGVTDANGLPDAVRGLYLSTMFPGGEQNVSGWADWCGSSFATSIASGLGAHLIAQGWAAGKAILRLSAVQDGRGETLFGEPPEASALLGNILQVRQRFGL
jgi:hypothetical protein